MDHEIDSYDPTTGTAAFWVRIPTLSHTTNTAIYMWYGDSAITASQENKAGVWRNGYVDVWHFNTLSGSLGTQGSGNGNPLPTVTSGFLGNSGLLLTAASYNSVVMNSSVNAGSTMTIETWIKPKNLSGYAYAGIASNLDNVGGYGLRISYYPSDLRVVAFEENASLQSTSATSASIPVGAWTHIAQSMNGTLDTTYINGAISDFFASWEPPGTSVGAAVGASSTNLVIGNLAGYYDGLIDELRISSVVRSP